LQTNQSNKTSQGSSLAYIALATTSIVWGTTWVAMKFGLKGIPALELATIRQFIGGSIFIIFFLLKKTPLPTLAQFKQLAVVCVFTFVLANGVSTWSLQYISSGLASLIGALYPLCVVVIEFIFYKQAGITKKSVFGIFLGIVGIGFVFYENAFSTHGSGYWLGVFLAIVAMLSWSFATILIAKQSIKINAYYGMGWQMLFSSFILFFGSLAMGKNIPLSSINLQSWLVIGYLILAGSIVAVVAFIYSMRHLPASVAALYAYINPIIAVITGSILLREHISLSIIIGTVITLIGVYLVNRFTKKKIDKKEEELPDAELV
jgi:drug/metabolite transporter (DMT)-like permease